MPHLNEAKYQQWCSDADALLEYSLSQGPPKVVNDVSLPCVNNEGEYPAIVAVPLAAQIAEQDEDDIYNLQMVQWAYEGYYE